MFELLVGYRSDLRVGLRNNHYELQIDGITVSDGYFMGDRKIKERMAGIQTPLQL
ncbi:hypothetical protein WDW86_08525 [Bdellovibrionota bacterium FG-2]